jgi:hypothetical protein
MRFSTVFTASVMMALASVGVFANTTPSDLSNGQATAYITPSSVLSSAVSTATANNTTPTTVLSHSLPAPTNGTNVTSSARPPLETGAANALSQVNAGVLAIVLAAAGAIGAGF